MSSERGAEVEAPGSQEGGSLPSGGYSVISRPLICFKSKTLLDECYTAFFDIDLEQMEGEKQGAIQVYELQQACEDVQCR